MEEFERLLRKNKQGNYGLFAEKCDHCVEGPVGGSMLSSESSLHSITLEKPFGKHDNQRGSVFDQKEGVSHSHNKMFSKGRGLESIREDDKARFSKANKKSVAFR